MKGTIYIVNCVDAEGPLFESTEATFQRIYESFNVSLSPSEKTLNKLKNKEIDLGENTDPIADYLLGGQLEHNETWDQIYEMFNKLLSNDFRNQVLDSFGEGYKYSWFCLDHVGYYRNSRRRTMGFHAVFEEYKSIIEKYLCKNDTIQFHYHPMNFARDAFRSGNNFSFSNLHNEILARRIIDHSWFPAAYRPTASIRPDASFWLEQWIPFDFGNLNTEDKSNKNLDRHLKAGRVLGLAMDSRGAPTDWSIYHPSYRDPRKPGKMKRYIARCLMMKSYCHSINEYELKKAFAKADNGENVLVSVANHDFRDMVSETEEFMKIVDKVSKDYSGVKFAWSTPVKAFREVLHLKKENSPQFNLKIQGNILTVSSDKSIWGPQPFLAFCTKEGNYYHDNFIIDNDKRWRYSFDLNSVPIDAISKIGVASNDDYGNTIVYNCDLTRNLKEWNIKEYNKES